MFAKAAADKDKFQKDLCYNQVIKVKIEQCLRIEGCAKRFYLAIQKELLGKAVAAANPHAGGALDGSDWWESLPMVCTWDDWLAECKKTLLQNELVGKELPGLRKRVLEDRAIP